MSLAELEEKIQPIKEVGQQLDALHDLLMFNKQKSNFEFEQDIDTWEDKISGEYASQKYILFCSILVILITAIIGSLSYLWIKISEYRENNKEAELDQGDRDRLMCSNRIQGAVQHYQRNMCVQYPSEEEYIRVMLVREQEKMKQKLEYDRQRYMETRK